MSDAAAAPIAAAQGIQHRTCHPGQYPQLSEQDREIVRDLGYVGIPRNAAGILLVFLRQGQDLQVTSYWLEHVLDARQPEISIALAWLSKEGQIRSATGVNIGKGRPLKVFVLVNPVEEYIRKKILQYRNETETRVTTLTRHFPGAA